MDDVRLDKYLWAVRIFKTRSDAAEAIRTNRVTVGGATCKPSREVRIGDVIAVKRMPVVYQYKVLDLVTSRQPAKNFEILAVAERLKCNTRHSWTSTGRRESVAEHSWRLALMALLVADEFPDVDCGRVVRMCLVHDLGEAFTGDIPAFEKRRQDETHEAALLARWVETLPEPLRAEWRSLYAEMEALATPEARLYKALDKLEAVIQHNEADIATWLPLEYDLNIAYGADEVAWNGYLRRLKEAANEISRQKIAEARRQAPDDAGK